MNKRENTILSLLSECGRLEVAELARRLEVSAVTVRKDLDELERRGVIRREHGSAIFGGNDDINNRLAFHYEEKQRIAREAVESLPEPDRSIFLRFYYLYQKTGDIAAALHMKPAAVRARLSRGRERLKAILEERGIGHEAACH